MIREANAADIPQIRALMRSVPGFWQPRWSDDTIGKAIESAQGAAFVWEDNAHILGFVCAHDLGFRAYLSELVVDEGVRGQGIATRLVRAVEDVLAARGQQILIADVWREAEGFYRSLGWEAPDAVLLRRRLKTED
jgi:ribosomal protein S18 acetylase RimI-like enzyme